MISKNKNDEIITLATEITEINNSILDDVNQGNGVDATTIRATLLLTNELTRRLTQQAE